MSANRIDEMFERLKHEGKKALIGYVTAGYPDRGSLKSIVAQMESSGVDLLELGVPFSDPIADGPTIQRSSQVALAKGATLAWVIETVTSLRKTIKLPLVLMSYSNPILAMGVDRFFSAARRAGIDGLIIPDIIPEESSLFEGAARRENVHLIYLVSPTTPLKRIRWIASKTEGFLYAVSVAGVTGARSKLSVDVAPFLKSVRSVCKKPLAVGFGLSTPAQVADVARYVDGVIVGSALIKTISESKTGGFRKAGHFMASLKRSLDRWALQEAKR